MAKSKKLSWSLYYSDNSPSLSLYVSLPLPPYHGTFTYKHSKKNIELSAGKFLKFTHTIQGYLRFTVTRLNLEQVFQ